MLNDNSFVQQVAPKLTTAAAPKTCVLKSAIHVILAEAHVLVTFKTNAYSDITMFGDSAVTLLKLMGQSGNVPGAIMAPDIAGALETLRSGLARLDANTPVDEGSLPADGSSDEKPPVSLSTRAGPLIELLEAAQASQENVLWDQ